MTTAPLMMAWKGRQRVVSACVSLEEHVLELVSLAPSLYTPRTDLHPSINLSITGTFWLVEALTRASIHYPELLERAIVMFEQMIAYGNHLTLFSEEIARSGEMLGNFPQAFTHIALMSAAFNLDRVLAGYKFVG